MSSESGAAASGASVQEGGDTPVAECQALILEQMSKIKHVYAICVGFLVKNILNIKTIRI